MKRILLTVLGFFIIGFSQLSAQERAVGGSLQTEASWSALKSMVERTDGNVAVLKIDVDAMKACGAQKKIWTGTQCVNADMVDNIITCGDQGKVYDKSANECVATAPNRWTFLQLGDPRLYLGAYPKNPPRGSPCTNSALNLGTCSSVGSTCYTTRFASRECTGGDGNSGACNARYDGYAEIFKCI